MVNWRQYFNSLESCMHILRCWMRKERHWIAFYLGKCMFIKLERILLNFYSMKNTFQGSKSTSRIRMDNRNDTHPTWYARQRRSMEQGLDLGCASERERSGRSQELLQKLQADLQLRAWVQHILRSCEPRPGGVGGRNPEGDVSRREGYKYVQSQLQVNCG